MPTEPSLPSLPPETLSLPTGDSNEAILARLDAYKNVIERCSVEMARDLWTVFHLKRYVEMGFETFDDFVKIRLGMSRDKADRLRRMFSKLVLKCDIKPALLEGIGRSKIEMILPVVTRENAREWIEKARELPYGRLELEVREFKARSVPHPPEPTLPESPVVPEAPVVLSKTTTASATPPTTFKTRTFRLPEDVITLLDEALGEAQRITKSASDAFNLACVLQHFLAHRMTQEGKKDSRLRFFMRHMEEIYGGRLLHVRNDKAWKVLQQAVESAPDLFDTSEKLMPDGIDLSDSTSNEEEVYGRRDDGDEADEAAGA